MVIPELIDIVYAQIIHKYREKIERDDNCILMTEADKDKEILCEKLNEEQKKLLGHYARSLENRLDYIYYMINTFVFR